MVFGLIGSGENTSIALEGFTGNTSDPATRAAPVDKVKSRFGLGRIIGVGDRGPRTSARIKQVLRPAGVDGISRRRAP